MICRQRTAATLAVERPWGKVVPAPRACEPRPPTQYGVTGPYRGYGTARHPLPGLLQHPGAGREEICDSPR